MLGEAVEKLYAVYLIPFSADDSYSLIILYKGKGENFYKALFLSKSLETGEEHKHVLKLDGKQFSEEQALKVFEHTAKDMFKREILPIDPGAKLVELKFDNPDNVEYNTLQIKELLKKAGFMD
jgi:hypothetical protein